MTTDRRLSSASASRSASFNAATSSLFNAFRLSGRLRVNVRTVPRSFIKRLLITYCRRPDRVDQLGDLDTICIDRLELSFTQEARTHEKMKPVFSIRRFPACNSKFRHENIFDPAY